MRTLFDALTISSPLTNFPNPLLLNQTDKRTAPPPPPSLSYRVTVDDDQRITPELDDRIVD